MSEQPTAHRFLEFAFLCDAASDKGGALDALGIGTTLIYASRLPAVHQLTLVLRIAWSGGRISPGPKHLDVRVTDPDGARIAEITGGFGVHDDDDAAKNLKHPEIPVGANLILPLAMHLTQYGLHHVEISVEGDSYPQMPLKVVDPNA